MGFGKRSMGAAAAEAGLSRASASKLEEQQREQRLRAAGKHCLSVCMQGLRAAGGLVPGGLLLLLLRRATAPVAPWRAYGEMRKAKAQLRLVMAMA